MTDDLIRRQDAIMVVKDQRLEAIGCIPESYNAGVEASASVLEMIPSAQRTGKWKKTGRWGRVYRCDQCGNYLDFDGVNVGRGNANYCPNCGARMDEDV